MGIQRTSGLRGLRHRVSPARTATLQFQQSPGACPECEGFGNVIGIDMDLIVPDPNKSLAEGAIAPWSTPAYEHESQELLALAPDYGIPTDVPFRELAPQHLALITRGVPERKFGGLEGFFAWLERRKYKMHIRVFLSRWRSARTCPSCNGARLRSEALAVRVAGKNLGEICRLESPRCGRLFPRSAVARLGTPDRPHDARTSPSPAGIPGRSRARLPDLGSALAHLKRRRGQARGA